MNLRDFALRVYAADGVAPLCLALQDGHGADVNLLLFCCWSAVCEGDALSAARLDAAVAATQDWQREVVMPLRALRRRLGTPPQGYREDGVAALRQALKTLELDAELMQLERLSALSALSARTAPTTVAAGLDLRLRENLHRYLLRCGASATALPTQALLRATCRVAEEKPRTGGAEEARAGSA